MRPSQEAPPRPPHLKRSTSRTRRRIKALFQFLTPAPVDVQPSAARMTSMIRRPESITSNEAARSRSEEALREWKPATKPN